jgi:hypothetical protein
MALPQSPSPIVNHLTNTRTHTHTHTHTHTQKESIDSESENPFHTAPIKYTTEVVSANIPPFPFVPSTVTEDCQTLRTCFPDFLLPQLRARNGRQ